MPPLLNQTIGEYRLVDFLGAGGMGEVYRGVHVRLGRLVAVKVLNAQSATPAMAQRFLNEARIQSCLRHPGVAVLYDFLEWQGKPIIVMEYVDGSTLCEMIEQRGTIPPAETVAIGSAIADTLGYVHSQGIIHRDLKTSNVNISSTGQVKLLDFGIARAQADSRLTQTGFVVGTFQYLSPEQVMGEQATEASDIWALGTVLYEMVTRVPPFDGSSPAEVFGKISKAEFRSPSALNPAVPRELEAVICRCLRRRAADRYGSAYQVRDELAALGSISTASHTLGEKPKRGLVDKIMSPVGLTAGLGGFVVLAGIVFFAMQPPAPPPAVIESTTAVQPSAPDDASTSKINIEVQGDVKAEVFEDGKRVGNTPMTIVRHFGDPVDVTLKADGYKEEHLQFTAQQREYNNTITLTPVHP